MLLTDPSASPTSQVCSTPSNLTVACDVPSSASSPGPKLWNMEMFAYLAVPLLIGTVMVPLISGKLLRFVVKTYTRLKPWFPLSGTVLLIIDAAYLQAEADSTTGTLRTSTEVILVGLMIYLTYIAFRKKKHRIFVTASLLGIFAWVVVDRFISIPVRIPWTVGWAIGWTILVVSYLFKSGLAGNFSKLRQGKDQRQTAGPR